MSRAGSLICACPRVTNLFTLSCNPSAQDLVRRLDRRRRPSDQNARGARGPRLLPF